MDSGDHSVAVEQVLQYAEEVLCASWNPLALLAVEPAGKARSPGIDGSDVDALLTRLYCCQQA